MRSAFLNQIHTCRVFCTFCLVIWPIFSGLSIKGAPAIYFHFNFSQQCPSNSGSGLKHFCHTTNDEIKLTWCVSLMWWTVQSVGISMARICQLNKGTQTSLPNSTIFCALFVIAVHPKLYSCTVMLHTLNVYLCSVLVGLMNTAQLVQLLYYPYLLIMPNSYTTPEWSKSKSTTPLMM